MSILRKPVFRSAWVICLLVATQGPAATVWNESTQGDLSNTRTSPTSVTLSIGSNDLFAASQGGDLEYVRVTVPSGNMMTGLFLRSYAGSDATAFLGMQRGTIFTESPFTPVVGNMLGYSHFGSGGAGVGVDLLPLIGNGPGAQGFTPPLPADSYTLWLQQLGGTTNYQLDFVLAQAPIPTWNVDADGDWLTTTNWSFGVPNTVGAIAVFGDVITAPRTVTVDVPVAVGRVDFDNANAYTIAGTGPLTLASTSGGSEVNVAGGSHTISAPVLLANDAVISVSPAASSLSITGGLIAVGANVTKTGDGSLTINHVRAAGLSIAGGNVTIASDGSSQASVVGALAIAGDATPTATFDLTSNAAVVDYSDASPADTVREQILAGRGGAGFGAPWTGMGITSSTVATVNATEEESRSIGYAENAALPLGAFTVFHGEPVDETSILMAHTRTADANLDGVVNDDDVTIVGATYAPGVPQPSWALGDFDYNGFVDDDDVTLLGVFYDPSAPPLVAPAVALPGANSVAAVPEPGTLLLAMLASAAMVALRTRR